MSLSRLRFRLQAALAVGIFLATANAFASPPPERLNGVVRVPESIEPADIQVFVHSEMPGKAENDPVPEVFAQADARGLFSIEALEPTIHTRIEFAGKGVRRAVFPWPFEVLQRPGARPAFRLQTGGWTELVLVDEETQAPVPGAVIGPLTPTEDVEREHMDRAYSFYARTDDKGRALITGLIPDQSYDVHVFAEGYVRKRLRLDSGRTRTLALQRGGLTLAGEIKGERTGRPFPGQIVMLTGGSEDFHILHRADEKSRFRFTGLPEGQYQLRPVLEDLGSAPPTEYALFGTVSLEDVVLLVSEGITISGMVANVETGEPIADADIFLRSRIFTTDTSGQFEFHLVQGPWPLEPVVRHPDYLLEPQDQDTEYYPLSGYDMNDIYGVVFKMRRKRYLVAHRECEVSSPREPSLLDIHGPLEDRFVGMHRERIIGKSSIFSLTSAGHRLFMLRSPSDPRLASPMTLVNTEMDATTTTVRLALGPAARIEGSLTYDDGPPHPECSILVQVPVGDPIYKEVELTTTSPNVMGQFAVDSLPPGPIIVRFNRPSGDLILEESFNLEPGQTGTLHRSIPRGLPFAGRVVDEEGKPLFMIPITAWGTDAAGNFLQLNERSDEDGSFKFEGFAGEVVRRLQVEYHGYAPYNQTDVPLPNDSFEIVMSDRQGIEVEVIAPPASLTFSKIWVMFGSQRPTETAGIQWFYDSANQTPLSGESTVIVHPGVEGRLRLAVDAEGDWDVSTAFEWTANDPTRTIQLRPGHTSSLTVRLSGIPSDRLDAVESMLINTALPDAAFAVEFQPTSRSGNSLVFEELPAGEYLLVVTSPDGKTASQTNLDIATGQRASVALDFESAAITIQGRVLTGDDTPLGGVPVSVRFADIAESDPIRETTTAQNGSFRFAELSANRPYLLEAQHDGRTLHRWIEAAQTRQDLDQADLVFDTLIAVTFIFPQSLIEAMERNRQPVFVKSAVGNDFALIRQENVEDSFDLVPGEYRVSLGDMPLDSIEIPRATHSTTVRLPEAP